MNKSFAKFVVQVAPRWVQYLVSSRNEIIFFVYPHSLVGFSFFLKNHINSQYKMLMDVTAIDYPTHTPQFEIVYTLLSIQYNSRIRIKTCVDHVTSVPSVTLIFPTAGWWEREVWDSVAWLS